MDTGTLDRFDHAILRLLGVDGRLSAAEVARRIGLSKSQIGRAHV